MKTIRTKVYQFRELSKEAKQTAIESFRDINVDYDWWDSVYDDATEIGKLMGIDISKIYFSGFSSQGDGACFEGSFCKKANILEAVKYHAPEDEKLHSIAKELEELYKKYNVTGTVKHSGHYYHEYCTSFDIEDDGTLSEKEYSEMEEAITEVIRSFMKWIYGQLESQYDYLTTNEAIIETLESNEYDFTKDGKLFHQ